MYFGKSKRRKFFGDRHWDEPMTWHRKAYKNERMARVFCGSMCDVFEARADLVEPRIRLIKLICDTQWLNWLLLTKRPEKMIGMLTYPELRPPNIWLGVSVENQVTADRRIKELLRHQAIIRFVSIEPLLEPVDISDYFLPLCLNWVIVGGETGPGARPMDPDWARSIRDQCRRVGVPFFLKQMARKEPIPEDLRIREFPGEEPVTAT